MANNYYPQTIPRKASVVTREHSKPFPQTSMKVTQLLDGRIEHFVTNLHFARGSIRYLTINHA